MTSRQLRLLQGYARKQFIVICTFSATILVLYALIVLASKEIF